MSIVLTAFATVAHPVPFSGKAAPGETGSAPTSFYSLATMDSMEDARAFILNLSGLENYVAERGWEAFGGMTPQLYALIQHIRAVKIEYRFERPDNYSAAGLRELADWAAQANAIFVLPDGSVRDAQGRDLLDPDAGGVVPRTGASLHRRDQVRSQLAERGVIVPGHLPPVRSEVELTPADPAEVLNRAVVLAVIADLSEEIYRGDDIDLDDVVDLQGSGEVTETEAEFLEQLLAEARGGGKWSDDLRAKALNHSWGFVAAHTLAWTLGLVPMDPYELQPADVSALKDALETAVATNQPQLRALGELCDAWEITYSCRWYAVDQQYRQGQPGDRFEFDGMQKSVLIERQRALAWLLLQDAPYDQVSLDT